jgi:hypothetical protein
MVTCFLVVFQENRSRVFWLFSQKKLISSLVYNLSRGQAPAQDLVINYLVTSRLASQSLQWHHLSSSQPTTSLDDAGCCFALLY